MQGAAARRTAYNDVLPAALTFAQRARANAASLARPAADILRLRLAAGLAEALRFLRAAQRALCAARILAIPAALIFLRFCAAATGAAGAPSSWLSSSCRASILSLTLAALRNCCGVRSVNVSIPT